MECISGGNCYDGKYCQCVACEKHKAMELLPCPFCGEKEDLAVRFFAYDGGCNEINGHTYAYIECMPCDAQTGHNFEADAEMNGFDNCKQMAISAWNRRVR